MKKLVVLLSKTFFPQHPKAGQQTSFNECVRYFKFGCLECPNGLELNGFHCRKNLGGKKIHTLRSNYEYWEKKIDKLKANGGVLSVRQWSGTAYRSPQKTIVDIPAEFVGVQKLRMKRDFSEACLYKDYDRYVEVNICDLAKNDGLSADDFKAWFRPVFDKNKKDILEIAIIHFTKFRY